MRITSPNYEASILHVRALSEHCEQRQIQTVPVIQPHGRLVPFVFHPWEGGRDWGLPKSKIGQTRYAAACWRNEGVDSLMDVTPKTP